MTKSQTLHLGDYSFSALLGAAQRWIREMALEVWEFESILGRAYELLSVHRGRVPKENVPAPMRNPYDLLVPARPPRATDDETPAERYAHCFARWLILCLPGEEGLQEDVCSAFAVPNSGKRRWALTAVATTA